MTGERLATTEFFVKGQPFRWEVKRGALVLPNKKKMKVSCYHKKRGACGGCYARMVLALELILAGKTEPKLVVAAVKEMQHIEESTWRLRGK